MADAGFKLTVEGEKEFRKAISDVNAILKLNQAELQRVAAEYNDSDKSIEAMTERQKDLGEVIDRQTAVVEQMEGELARLTDEYGENATGVVKMQAETEKARATLANLNAQFRSNAEEIEGASKMAEDYGMSMEEIEAQISAAEAEIKAMDAAMQGNTESLSLFGRRAEDAEKQVADLEKKHELLTSELAQQESKLEMLNSEMQEAVRLYGNQSKEVAEYRTKIAQTSTEMTELTRRIDENNREIEDAKDPAVDLKDVFSQISDIAGVQIPEGLTAMVGGIEAGTLAAGGLAASLVAANEKMKKIQEEMRQEAIDANAEILRGSALSGLDTDTYQEWKYIADQLNVSFDSIVDVLKDLRTNMYEASTGNEEFANEFANLGVEINSADGKLREADDILIELIEKYALVTNETERAARMQKLMGESSRELNLLIYAGSSNLEYYRNMAKEKAVQDKELLELTERQRKAQEELNSALEKTKTLYSVRPMAIIEAIAGKGSWETAWKTEMDYAKSLWETIVSFVKKSGINLDDQSVKPTQINYNVTIPASDIKEFNDLVRIAEDQRVTERMK